MKRLLAWLLLSLSSLAGYAADRPNVVILLADDQGWGDLSLNGNTNLATPNLDALGRSGARFDRFFVCPVCAPTRAELLTGRYHLRGGVRGVSSGDERLNLDERTLAEAFRAAGYATGAFGKWHNGSQWPYHPNARGFDEYYGFTSGHWAEYFDAHLEHNGEPVRGQGYITDDLTTHALAFIAQNRARPFFCYVPYNVPHSPFTVPEEDWRHFKDQPMPQRGQDGADEDLPVTRCVAAMNVNLDRNVGRVLRRLDELHLAANTIVVYFTDNGPNSYRWNGGMKGRKGSTDEGGVRSPLFVRWPGRIAPGTTLAPIAGAIDLLPTLTSLAGVPLPGSKPLDGRDLSPLLLGQTTEWPDRRIFSHWAGRASVRTQRYRLDTTGGLFDLQADPSQSRNIAADQPAVAAELRQALATWRTETGVGTKAAVRPFTVGYPAFPRSPLPARDGVAHGGAKRSSGAPNSSFFTRWQSTDDSLTWDIAVATAGTYGVAIDYTCPVADAGSTIEVSFNGNKITGTVAPGWDPPFYTNQDTLPRPAQESPAKEFHSLDLGSIRLEKGAGPLTLRALKIPGASVMDVRRVTLTLLPPTP